MKAMDVCGKDVAVIGLGASGFSSAKLLVSRGARVRVTDCADNDQIKARAEELRRSDARVEIGRHTREFIAGCNLVVTSPGVSQKRPCLGWASQMQIPIISELELASSIFGGQIVAITGTNGKTTVTTLVGQILMEQGMDVAVCGNIGRPFSEEVGRGLEKAICVVEVSSFQLERVASFRPRVSVILNVTPDHLDRYRNFDQYLQTKAKIFANQTVEDYCLLNEDDPSLRKLMGKPRAKVLTFGQGQGRFDPNQRAAMLVGSIYGIGPTRMAETIEGFKGLEHRLEETSTIDGVRFINDSKATNPEAVCWALERVEGPVVLIAGGRDKGSDFRILRRSIESRVKVLVLCGEAKDKLKKALDGLVPIEESKTFAGAFRVAQKAANPGDCILLSPACASFDMFNNFEERGRAFKEMVARCRERRET